MIKSINQINKNTAEGKLLKAAVIKISESDLNKTIPEIFEELNELADKLEKKTDEKM